MPIKDDRMGFYNFLKASQNERFKQEARIESQRLQALENDTKSSFKHHASNIAYGVLLTAIICTAILSLITTHPDIRIIGLTLLTALGLIAAGLSSHHGAYRLKSVSILMALTACLGLMTTLAQSFGVHIFSSSQSSFWITAALISLVTAWVLKSRIALIISIALTVFWSYAAFTAHISLSPAFFALPFFAALQVLVAYNFGDGFSSRLSQLILYGWGLTALLIAMVSGLTTPVFILSGLTLSTGLIYLSTTHPFSIWASDPRRGLSLLSWFAFMCCCIATSWQWLIPTALGDARTPLPPLTDFIWQIGLISGGLALSAAALFRRAYTSHSLPRRICGGLIIFGLAGSHYLIATQTTGLANNNLGTIFMISAVLLLGGLSIVVINKVAVAIRYEHNGFILTSLVIMIAVFLSLIFVSQINSNLLYVSGLGALLTIFGLSLTQKHIPTFDANTTIYRPLKKPPAQSEKVLAEDEGWNQSASYKRAL